MSTAELVLAWAELLLQTQVVLGVLVVVAMLLWRQQIRELLAALAERGFRLSAGSISGELVAAAGDAATPSATRREESRESYAEAAQSETLRELALRFAEVARRGPRTRSAFAQKIRSEYAAGWSWPFLEKMLAHPTLAVRFCAASLLVCVVDELAPEPVAELLSRESSSLVRFRLIEALRYWASVGGGDERSRAAVAEKLREHVEENVNVQEKVSELRSLLGS